MNRRIVRCKRTGLRVDVPGCDAATASRQDVVEGLGDVRFAYTTFLRHNYYCAPRRHAGRPLAPNLSRIGGEVGLAVCAATVAGAVVVMGASAFARRERRRRARFVHAARNRSALMRSSVAEDSSRARADHEKPRRWSARIASTLPSIRRRFSLVRDDGDLPASCAMISASLDSIITFHLVEVEDVWRHRSAFAKSVMPSAYSESWQNLPTPDAGIWQRDKRHYGIVIRITEWQHRATQ